ncbi:hypothetical protein PFISCL1PPCAC_5475, partial [Pristionchus fissidentatus]
LSTRSTSLRMTPTRKYKKIQSSAPARRQLPLPSEDQAASSASQEEASHPPSEDQPNEFDDNELFGQGRNCAKRLREKKSKKVPVTNDVKPVVEPKRRRVNQSHLSDNAESRRAFFDSFCTVRTILATWALCLWSKWSTEEQKN